MTSLRIHALAAACIAALAVPAARAADENTLVGFALMPADTFAPGPTSGQFVAGANGKTLPLVDLQPVQGFSAVLDGPVAGSYYVMPDNGFGTKANSSDAMLRMYALMPDFRTASGGSGTVSAVDFTSGLPQSSFNPSSYISLRDPDHQLTIPLIADRSTYPYSGSGPGNASIPVDPAIRSGRLLTGADFDIESTRRDAQGNLWFGDEFGPYLVKTDATGKVLRSEIPLPGVKSPDNPTLNGAAPNLNSSNGFEGMAINKSGDKLYTLLEGTVQGDPAKSLRINEFDISKESFTGKLVRYQLDPRGTNIGDMTAVDDHRFLVIERDGTSGDPSGFKKIFLVDTAIVDANGFAKKTELVDLMNIADPNDLNKDGKKTFNFPFVTIEDVLVLEDGTLLVINDNNYPGGGGRGAGIADNTEFLKISLAQPVPEPTTWASMLAGLAGLGVLVRRRGSGGNRRR